MTEPIPTVTPTAQAPESASQTAPASQTTQAPVSASPTAATLAPSPVAKASVSPDAETRISNEAERKERLLKEQQAKTLDLQAKIEALQVEANAAQAMREALRGAAIEGRLRDAGIALPERMATLAKAEGIVKPEHYGADQKLNAEGVKAMDAFIASLGDDLKSRKTASAPGQARGPVIDPTATKFAKGSGFDVMNKMMKGAIQ